MENEENITKFSFEEVDPKELSSYIDLEKSLNVTEFEKEKILERLKEEEKLAGEESKPSILEEKYLGEVSDLEKQKLNTKLNYISGLVGEPVVNEAPDMGTLDLIKLRGGLSRSKYFETRQNKFLDKFPEGAYTRIQVPVAGEDDVPEYLEIFKLNKDDKQWGIINPYGRDVGEVGAVLGTVFDEQTAGEILSGFLPFKKGSKVALAGKVGLGAFFGIKARKLNESLMGYGEEEFAGKTIGDVDWIESLTNSNDLMQALIASGFQFGSDVGMGLITGKIRPGLVEAAPDVIAAADRLGLDPLVFAQLSSLPLIRRVFFQAGEFAPVPQKVLDNQLITLKKSLEDFSGGKKLSEGELYDIVQKLELQMQNDMIFFKNSDVAMREANESLAKNLKELNKVNDRFTTKLTNKAIRFSDDSSVTLKGLKDKGGVVRNKFTSAKFPGKPETKKIVDPETGEITFETITPKKQVGGVPQEVDSLLSDIQKLPTAFNAVDGQLKGLDALVKLREKAYKLTLSSDPKINAAGKEIYDQLANMFDVQKGFFQGSGEFISTLNMLNNQISNAEKVNKMAFIKQALSENLDPDTFAQTFMKPDNNLKMGALKNILLEGDTKMGTAAWNNLQKAWITRTLRGSGDEIIDTLDAWKKAGDEDGLNSLLGDNAPDKLEALYSLGKKKQRLENNSLFQESLNQQATNAEIIFNVIKKSKKGELGASAEIDRLIAEGGEPFVESVRAGLIENLLNDASKVNKDTLQKTIDIGKLANKIKELGNNTNLMKFFDADDLKALQDYDTYVTLLSQQTDVGGKIAAGAEAAEVATLKPSKLVKAGVTALKYGLLAKALAKKQTQSIFAEVGDDFAEDPLYRSANVVVSRLLRESGQSPEEVEEYTIFDSYSSDDEGNPIDLQSSAQVPVEVPTTAVPGSAVSSAQVVAPLPTMGQGAPMNVARAQQAFPFDPIFAAADGGIADKGIMNTSRGRQMVV